MEYSVVLNPKIPINTRHEILPGNMPRAIVLRRTAGENGSIIGIRYDGKTIEVNSRVEGELTVYPLPECEDAMKLRVLELNWQAKTKRSRQVHFEIVNALVAINPISPKASRLPTRLPNEIDEAIAQSIGCDPVKFAGIVERLAERYNITPESMLEFFGPDGMTTVEPEWIAQCKERAKTLGLAAGELIAAHVMTGVAKSVSEAKEFSELMKEAQAGKPTGQLPDDFAPPIVAVDDKGDTEPPPPNGVPTSIEVPLPTMGNLQQVAKRLEVNGSWLMSAVAIVGQLRNVNPNDIMFGLVEMTSAENFDLVSYCKPDWQAEQTASSIIDLAARHICHDNGA